MKLTFIIISIIICVLQTNAQSTKPRYDTCSHLQSLEGEWRYVNGIDTIRVYLKAHRSKLTSFNSISDQLWGWQEYKRGNIIIQSDYENRFYNLPYETDTLSGNVESILLKTDSCSPTITKLFGVINDLSQGNEPKIVKAILDTNGMTMTWRQEHATGYGFFSGFTGMTLPREFVLVKQ